MSFGLGDILGGPSAWWTNAFGSSLGIGGAGGHGTSGGINTLKALMDPAFSDVLGGTKSAEEQLRSAYEGQFRQRVGGLVGGYQDQASHLGAQGASQGLSGDVVQRMLTGQGAQLQSQIGQARGESQFGLGTDLAQLLKGTGSEMAGLHMNEAAVLANYMAALKGAKATQQAGLVSGIGGGLGSLLGFGLGHA